MTIVTGPYTTIEAGYSATFVGTLAANGESCRETWSSNQQQSTDRAGFAAPARATSNAQNWAGNSSFCSVIYVPPPAGIPIGSQPPITGTYSGDGVFASSSAQPRSPLPRVPQASAQPAGPSVPLTMSCPRQTVCTGAAQMTTGGTQPDHGAAAAASVLVASGRYSIAAHAKAKVKLRLSSQGKALLKKHRNHLVVTLKIQPTTGAAVGKAIVLK